MWYLLTVFTLTPRINTTAYWEPFWKARIGYESDQEACAGVSNLVANTPELRTNSVRIELVREGHPDINIFKR